jgi:glycosyltransferase involved in cell wall biosynthesis
VNAGRRRLLYVVNVDWFFVSHRLPLAVAARERGFEVWVAAKDTGFRAKIESRGMHFVPLSMSRASLNPLREVVPLVQVVRAYLAVKPDIAHHVSLKSILYGSLAARLVRRTKVVNAVAGQGGLAVGGGSRSSRVAARAAARAVAVVMRGRQALAIFQNVDDRRQFVESYGFPPDRAHVIPGSGVDCELFRPSALPDGPPVVVMAGRLLWPKGVGEFVEAARTVRRRHPGARFVLVGAPDEDSSFSVSRDQLESWAEAGDVEWWGVRDDMPSVLREATVVVLPTYYGEGVPKVLLEAAASARPIVTTDTPGCRDVVQHGVTGLLVGARDPQALAQAVGDLLADRAQCADMGERGRALVEGEFRVEQVVDRTLDLYYDLLR